MLSLGLGICLLAVEKGRERILSQERHAEVPCVNLCFLSVWGALLFRLENARALVLVLYPLFREADWPGSVRIQLRKKPERIQVGFPTQSAFFARILSRQFAHSLGMVICVLAVEREGNVFSRRC